MVILKDIKTAKSTQEMQNLGFDTEFNLPAVENLVYNPTTGDMDRMVQPATSPAQTDGSQKTQIVSQFNTNKIDTTTTAGVAYLCEEDKDGIWQFTRITTATNVFGYATVSNNPTKNTYALALTSLASLTYDLYSVAK